MYQRRSTRLPLTLVVLLLSVGFGAAVSINQMQLTSQRQPTSDVQTPSTSTDPLTSPSSTPDIQRYSLFVPSLGITARLIHLSISGGTWNVEGLGNNVGHLMGTSWFQDVPTGNVVLA